jgi:hypothetical protein
MSNLISEFKIGKNSEGKTTINDLTFGDIIKNSANELTYFEKFCKPRIIKNEDKVEISEEKVEKIIKEILRCRICLDIYDEPVNNKDCLHQFCKKCIEEYIRKFKRECVICRKEIETRRVLREDNKIKEIIKCIIPEINSFQEIEKKIFTETLKKLSEKENPLNLQIDENESYYKKLNDIQCQNCINETFIGKKRNNVITSCLNDNFLNNQNEITVKISTENETLKHYYQNAFYKIDPSFTLYFFAKFICFKQNWNQEYISYIKFYLIEKMSNKSLILNNSDTISSIISKNQPIFHQNKNIVEIYFSLNGRD